MDRSPCSSSLYCVRWLVWRLCTAQKWLTELSANVAPFNWKHWDNIGLNASRRITRYIFPFFICQNEWVDCHSVFIHIFQHILLPFVCVTAPIQHLFWIKMTWMSAFCCECCPAMLTFCDLFVFLPEKFSRVLPITKTDNWRHKYYAQFSLIYPWFWYWSCNLSPGQALIDTDYRKTASVLLTFVHRRDRKPTEMFAAVEHGPVLCSDSNILCLSWKGRVPKSEKEKPVCRKRYYEEGWLATGNGRGVVGVTFTSSHCRRDRPTPQRVNFNLRGHNSEVSALKRQ